LKQTINEPDTDVPDCVSLKDKLPPGRKPAQELARVVVQVVAIQVPLQYPCAFVTLSEAGEPQAETTSSRAPSTTTGRVTRRYVPSGSTILLDVAALSLQIGGRFWPPIRAHKMGVIYPVLH
jgi:hypothetical protein